MVPREGFFGHLGLWLVRLRWVVILAWSAAAVCAYLYLSPLDDSLTGRLSDLVPEDPGNLASRPAALSQPGEQPGPSPRTSPSREPASSPERPAFPEDRGQGPPSPLGSVEAPAILVFSDPGGIGSAGTDRIETDLAYLNGPYGPRRLELAVPLTVPDPTTAAPSNERTVLPVLLFFETGTSGTAIRVEVEDIRDALGDRPGSPNAEVTGMRPVGEDTIGAVKGNLGKVTAATALVIFAILALTYRSPVAPLVPLASIGLAIFLTLRLVAFFALEGGTPIPAQVEPVILVLLFGVGTDYALFLLSRTRQVLRGGASRAEAARLGVEQAGGVVVSSAAVLVAAFAVLGEAELEVYQTLGPGLALALVVLTLVTVTLVPALLAVVGRGAFGGTVRPTLLRPRSGSLVGRRPGLVAGALAAVLLVAALGSAGLRVGFDQVEALPDDAPAARGYDALAEGFPAGILSPVNVVVQGETWTPPSWGACETNCGARGASPPCWDRKAPASCQGCRSSPRTAPPPASSSFSTARPLLARSPRPDTAPPYGPPRDARTGGARRRRGRRGGQAALAAEGRSVSDADLFRLAPLVLASAFVVLALLLRTPVAPLYLLGTTVLSFAATLGATTVLFQTVLGHGGVVYYVSFTLFILLVALGSDYNIFIMAAIREEAKEKPLPEAVAAALAGTRGTINAAGLALAASFALLVLIPLQDFFQIGVAVALGILLDAFVIRSLLVPALVLLVGRIGFWPAKVRP